MFVPAVQFSDAEACDRGYAVSLPLPAEDDFFAVVAETNQQQQKKSCWWKHLLGVPGLRLAYARIGRALPDLARLLLTGYVVKLAAFLLLLSSDSTSLEPATAAAATDTSLQAGLFLGFLASDLILTGTIRLVSRQHLIELEAAAQAGNHRARTRKFRELNTTLLVATPMIALLLYFLAHPALSLVGVSDVVAARAAGFCRISIAAVVPRVVITVLSEAVLVPQLGAVPVGALALHAAGFLLCVLVVQVVHGGVGFSWCAGLFVVSDVALAMVRALVLVGYSVCCSVIASDAVPCSAPSML